jgi:hypothetical protein
VSGPDLIDRDWVISLDGYAQELITEDDVRATVKTINAKIEAAFFAAALHAATIACDLNAEEVEEAILSRLCRGEA